MAYRLVGIVAAVSAVVAAGLVAGCAPSVASMTCDRIAEEAKQISQRETVKISTITNVRETSRTETEARCQGSATLSDNSSGDLYLRAYAHNNGTMVEYSGQPFAAAGGQPAAPQAAQPPAQPAPAPQQPAQQGSVPGYDQPAGDQQQPPPADGDK